MSSSNKNIMSIDHNASAEEALNALKGLIENEIDFLHQYINKTGDSANKKIDMFGNEVESAFKYAGKYSDETFDLIGQKLSGVPYIGDNLNIIFDKTGDATEEFLINTGEYLDDKIDSFGEFIDDSAEYISDYFII
jgi:hypothetical protein